MIIWNIVSVETCPSNALKKGRDASNKQHLKDTDPFVTLKHKISIGITMVSKGIWGKYLKLYFKIVPKYHESLWRVIFGKILKYCKRCLSQIPHRNHCVICLYYKADKFRFF